MQIGSSTWIEQGILKFKKRLETEREFCERLFREQSVYLFCNKYLYYIKANTILEDRAYDISEKSWFIMGVALGYIEKDGNQSICTDFDFNHPLASEGIELAKKLNPSAFKDESLAKLEGYN